MTLNTSDNFPYYFTFVIHWTLCQWYMLLRPYNKIPHVELELLFDDVA